MILTASVPDLAVALTVSFEFNPYRGDMSQKNYHWVRRLAAVAATLAIVTGSIDLADATALPDCGGAGAGACGQLFVTPAFSGPGGTMSFNQSFLGAHYDPSWGLAAGKVGFCTDESAGGLGGAGAGTVIPLPSGAWTAEQQAQVAWLVSVGQNNANPYTDLATVGGELSVAAGSVSPRNRMAAVHLAIRDAAPDLGSGKRFELTGSTGGGAIYNTTLAPLATALADAAALHAVRGTPSVALEWVGGAPRGAGTYRVRLTLTDSIGSPIEYAPVLPTITGANVSFAGNTTTRPYLNGVAAGFPTQDGFGTLPGDRTSGRAGITDLAGVAEFDITLATNRAGHLRLAGSTVSSRVELVDGGVGAQDNVTTAGTQTFLGTVTWAKALREVSWTKMVRGSNGQEVAGPAGVTFEIRNASGLVVATVATGSTGRTPSVELDDGTYSYTEIAVPDGVLIDPTTHAFDVSTTVLLPVVFRVVDAVTPTVQTFIHDLTRAGAMANTALEGDRIVLRDDATVTGTPGTVARVTVDFYVTNSAAFDCSTSPLASASRDIVVGVDGTGTGLLDPGVTWTATVGTFTVIAAERVSAPSVGWVGPRRCNSPTERFALKVVPRTRVVERTS